MKMKRNRISFILIICKLVNAVQKYHVWIRLQSEYCHNKLVLTMQKMLLFFAITLLFACNDDAKENDNVLHQPPFHALSDSISKDPGNAGLYYRRGILLYGQDEKELAGNDLRTAWNLDPNET